MQSTTSSGTHLSFRDVTMPAARSSTSPSIARAHPYRSMQTPTQNVYNRNVARNIQTDPLRRYSRSTDKSKGLRHFSTKVCEKVKEKGQTSYNEVADELVQDYFAETQPLCGDDLEKQQYEMKNIRRRVYDALNVLMAMNIIQKEKKEIRWVGLPTTSAQECERLRAEKDKREERIKHKAEQLHELIVQLVTYKALVGRNRELERTEGRPPANSVLYLPYIIVSTDKNTTVEVSISHDKTEYLFNFDQSFAIHDDIEVLKRLGLASGVDTGDIKPADVPGVKALLPPALAHYVDNIMQGTLHESPATGGEPQTNAQLDKLTEAAAMADGDDHIRYAGSQQ